jgi:hypothetical protein
MSRDPIPLTLFHLRDLPAALAILAAVRDLEDAPSLQRAADLLAESICEEQKDSDDKGALGVALAAAALALLSAKLAAQGSAISYAMARNRAARNGDPDADDDAAAFDRLAKTLATLSRAAVAAAAPTLSSVPNQFE